VLSDAEECLEASYDAVSGMLAKLGGKLIDDVRPMQVRVLFFVLFDCMTEYSTNLMLYMLSKKRNLQCTTWRT
jgi:hypothetical protein